MYDRRGIMTDIADGKWKIVENEGRERYPGMHSIVHLRYGGMRLLSLVHSFQTANRLILRTVAREVTPRVVRKAIRRIVQAAKSNSACSFEGPPHRCVF